MNKKTLKIAGWALGLSMAVAGIGLAVGATQKTQIETKAVEVGDLVYTLDGTTTATGNAYSDASTLTQTGIGWSVVGNTEQSPWRIGGKSISKVDRAIYSTTAISANIAEIQVKSGATASSLTVNSLTISVHANAADASTGGNPIATKSVTSGIASSTVTFTKADTTSWAGKFFRIVYNVTRTGSSGNGYITFESAKFFKEAEASSYAVTYNGNGNTGGVVPVDSTSYALAGTGTCTVLGNVGGTNNDGSNPLTKTHFTFNGWNTQANGLGTARAVGDTFLVGENVTLYAQWISSEVWLTTTSGEVGIGAELDISTYVSGATGTVTYSTSNDKIATVSSTGVITGVAAGEATITVSDSGTSTNASFTVTVLEYDNDFDIVDGGAYKIHHTKKGSTDVYYPKSNGDALPLATLNSWESIVFNFRLVGDNTFSIMSGSDYLFTSNSNNGLRIGSTVQSWKLLNGTEGKTGDYEVQNQSWTSRYLALYGTQDFRTYDKDAGNRTENTDLTLYTDVEFAADILDASDTVCSEGYNNSKSDFDDIWTILTADYAALVSADKSDFTEAVANASGTNLQKAAARYDYLVGKYKLTDFANRKPASIPAAPGAYFFGGNNDSSTPVVITVVSLGVLTVGGLFLVQKKRRQD